MNSTTTSVFSVQVEGRMDGLYLFVNEADAEAFRNAVLFAGGSAWVNEEPINHSATELIEAELEMDL